MILSELAGYMTRHRRVALLDMVHRFGASPDVVRSMLATLERKGRVRRVEGAAACGTSCGKCNMADLETYEWVGVPASPSADGHP